MYPFAAFFPAGLVDREFCVRMTCALLHLVWLGALLGLLSASVAVCLRRASARLRYALHVASLLILAACLPVTYLLVEVQPAPTPLDRERAGRATEPILFAVEPLAPASSTATGDVEQPPSLETTAAARLISAADAPSQPASTPSARPTAADATATPSADLPRLPILDRIAPYAATLWFAGVFLMTLRLLAALWGGHRLRHEAVPVVDSHLLQIMQGLARQIGLKAIPVVAWCGRVSTPIVVGVLTPAILLPASLAGGVSVDQLAQLLTHELAHIRRFDLAVNLLQRAIEALLFFHPAVWFISRQISRERENCCDDCVLAAGWNPVAYAGALVRMAELCSGSQPTICPAALAATGAAPSEFKRRVLRLLSMEPRTPLRLSRLGVASMGMLLAAAMIGPALERQFAGTQAASAAEIAALNEPRDEQSQGPQPASEEQRDLKETDLGKRTLRFPADCAVGIVQTRARRQGTYKYTQYSDWQRVGEARGDVLVPRDADVLLEISKAASKDLSFLDALDPDDVQILNLRGTDVNDDGLRNVGRLAGLRILDLDQVRITDAGVHHLAGLKHLQQIDIEAFGVNREGFGIGDEALRALALGRLAELKAIGLRLTKVGDEGMAALALLKSLESIDISGTQVTDAGMVHLKSLPHLDYLRLGVYDEGAKITDAGLAHVGEMTQLKHLDLCGTPVTDAGLTHLRGLTQLESLSLDNTKVTENGLAHLEPLSALRDLRCYIRVGDAGAKHLAKLRSLRRIVSNLHISDDGVAALAALPALERLTLTGQGITDAAVEYIAGMSSLKEVGFQNCSITDNAIAKLHDLRQLVALSLYRTRVTGGGLKHLSVLPKFERLYLSFSGQDDEFYGGQPTLRHVRELSSLKFLDIGGRGLASSELKYLEGLTELETLEIDEMPVDDKAAFYIGGLTSLAHLELRDSVITDVGLGHLSRLRKLTHMTLSGHFTLRGLESLQHLPALSSVQLSSPYLTKADAETFAAAVPSLQGVNRYDYEGSPFGDVSQSDNDDFRRDGGMESRKNLNALEGLPAPELHVDRWLNAPADGLTWEDLRGKVVLVDFWGAWCGPCVGELPRLKRLHARFEAQGLVIVGVHTTRGAEKMRNFVAKEQIPWAVASDVENTTTDGWHAPSFPSYYLVDRSGKVRVARIYRGDLDLAIKSLLSEN